MKNIKNIAKGLLLFSFVVSAIIATPAKADNSNENKGNTNTNGFLSAQASLRAEAFMKFESSSGVVMGPSGSVKVFGAKVTSVSDSEINATVAFGNSALNFVVSTDAETKLNGKLLTDASVLTGLATGDRISFDGAITSSTSSSVAVNGDHIVSQALYGYGGKMEKRTSFEGEVKSVNTGDSSFIIKLKSGVNVEVSVSGSTVITLDGATVPLSSLVEGDKVKVAGDLNTDGSVITASKVSAVSADNDLNQDNDDNKGNKNENGGGFWGKIMHWFWK